MFVALLLALGPAFSCNARSEDIPDKLNVKKTYSFVETIRNDDLRPVITSLALSADGSTIYIGGDSQEIYACNVEQTDIDVSQTFRDPSRSNANYVAGKDWIRALALSPSNPNLLASLSQDGQVVMWDVRTRRPVMKSSASSENDVKGGHALTFIKNGEMLVASAYKSFANVYDSSTLQQFTVWEAPSFGTTELASSALPGKDGKMKYVLAMGGRSGQLRVFRIKDPSIFAECELVNSQGSVPRRIRAIAFSPSGRFVAFGGDSNRVQVCEIRLDQNENVIISRPVECLSGVDGKVCSLTFCGETQLAAGYSTNIVRVWDFEQNRITYEGTGHTGTVSTMCYDAQNNLLYTGSFDTTVKQWSLPTLATEIVH